MELENIKELAKTLYKANYKEVFAAIIVFEKLSYLQDIEDLTDGDTETLEEIYQKFMDSKTITGLLNPEINEIIEEIEERGTL